MNCIDLKGRVRRINHAHYLIDWDRKVSGPQKQVKDFLRPHWENDLVVEELRIPGSLLRIDLWNLSKSIMVEVSPVSVHTKYNPFFHGSLAAYRASIKRDLDKARFAEANKLTYIEIEDPSTQLTTEWFLNTHQISL